MSSRAPLKLGTRGSDLARTQSTTVADALRAAGHDVELTIIKTAGDRDQTSQFGSIGAQGIFVREIEQALVERRIELAVHSFKDLPTTSPDALVIGAVPKRFDPADLLLVRSDALSGSATDWLPLKPGARVGTSSARRRVRFALAVPTSRSCRLRGNVPTRIRRSARATSTRSCSRPPASSACVVSAACESSGALDGVTVIRGLDPQMRSSGACAGRARGSSMPTRATRAVARSRRSTSGKPRGRRRRARALRRAEGGCDVAFGAFFVHATATRAAGPGHSTSGSACTNARRSVRVARVRGAGAERARRGALGRSSDEAR